MNSSLNGIQILIGPDVNTRHYSYIKDLTAFGEISKRQNKNTEITRKAEIVKCYPKFLSFLFYL